MPEENDQAAADAAAAAAKTEGEAGAGAGGEQTPDEKKAAEDATAEAAKAEADRIAAENAEPEVKPRKSAKDYIIERQQRKIEKLKTQPKDEEDEKSGDNSEDDDEIAPEDEALISRVVLKKFAPIIEKNLQAEDETELQEFLTKPENADFKPYEARVRKFMAHPSRRMLPISSIFYEVAGPELIKIGAMRQKKADDIARESSAGGGSARGSEAAKPDYATMSKEEFAKERELVRQKGRQ